MKEQFNDACQCIYERLDEELEDLSDDDFEDLPCATCGGRVVDMGGPASMAEEDDCSCVSIPRLRQLTTTRCKLTRVRNHQPKGQ